MLVTVGGMAQRQLRRTVNPLPLGSLVRVQVPPPFARVAQSVEHFVGNEEVTGSNPVAGSIRLNAGVAQLVRAHGSYP